MIYTFLIHHTSSTDGLHEPCVCVCVCVCVRVCAHEITPRRLRTRWVLSGLSLGERLSLLTTAYFFPPSHKNTTNKKKTKKKTTQSIEWGDRFTASQGQGSSGWMLSWSGLFFLPSFLSLRCPLGSHPSPSIPLFCLFYINTISPGRRAHTHIHSLSLCWFVLHTYTCTKTHTYTARAHTDTKGAVDRVW